MLFVGGGREMSLFIPLFSFSMRIKVRKKEKDSGRRRVSLFLIWWSADHFLLLLLFGCCCGWAHPTRERHYIPSSFIYFFAAVCRFWPWSPFSSFLGRRSLKKFMSLFFYRQKKKLKKKKCRNVWNGSSSRYMGAVQRYLSTPIK